MPFSSNVRRLKLHLPMFTYVTLGSKDLARSARFYDAVLGALGLQRCDTSGESDFDEWIGWGTYEDEGRTEIAFWVCQPIDGATATTGNGTMVAFKARSWKQVNEFHALGLLSGGKSEGTPGIRKQYNPDFYSAYLRDPDGNKIAAVCRGFTRENEQN